MYRVFTSFHGTEAFLNNWQFPAGQFSTFVELEDPLMSVLQSCAR